MGAVRVRFAARSAAVFVLVLGVVFSLPAGASGPPAVSGQVRDTVGNLLAGVEILFVNPDRASRPVAVTRSDRDGRFALQDLLPGAYQVAAVKEGYLTFVGGVDTLVQSTLDLVLHPALAIDDDEIPRDASWALRLPRRSVLREVEDGPAQAPRDLESEGMSARMADAMRVQVDQMFSVGADGSNHGTESAGVDASKTRMLLASTMGERGRIRFEGWRERHAADQPTDVADGGASRLASSVNVNLSYETGPDAELAVNAFFNQTDYELSTVTPTDSNALEQEQQTWGYDARWSRRVDAKNRFAVTVNYHDTALVSPGTKAAPEAPQPNVTQGVTARAVGAEGSYENDQYDRHRVRVALRAEMQQRPSTALLTMGHRPVSSVDPFSGWNLHAEATDTWSVTSPFALVYGLGYTQSLMAEEATLVVPRLGGSWNSGGWHLEGLVSYHAVTALNDQVANRSGTFQPATRVGYEAEIEIPLISGVHLAAGTAYTPIQPGYVGYVGGRQDSHPLYMTDGNTAVWQHRFAIVEERGPTRTYLELSHGAAEGTVLPLLPFEGPLPLDSGRSLRYGNGRLGVYLPARGADISLEYRRVESRGADPDDDSGSVQESVEVRARKAVSVFDIPGDWRVLMALRLGSVQTANPEYWASYGGGESIDALNRRVSAGVSVLF